MCLNISFKWSRLSSNLKRHFNEPWLLLKTALTMLQCFVVATIIFVIVQLLTKWSSRCNKTCRTPCLELLLFNLFLTKYCTCLPLLSCSTCASQFPSRLAAFICYVLFQFHKLYELYKKQFTQTVHYWIEMKRKPMLSARNWHRSWHLLSCLLGYASLQNRNCSSPRELVKILRQTEVWVFVFKRIEDIKLEDFVPVTWFYSPKRICCDAT